MAFPYISSENILQYCLEIGANGYGKIPSDAATEATMTAFGTSGGGFFRFGVTPDITPDLDPNRYKMLGTGSQATYYTRLGARAVKFDIPILPCDVNVTYDTLYQQSSQSIIDLLCLAMGTSTNTTDDPAASQWGTGPSSWHYPYLRNWTPSIGIELFTRRAGNTTGSLAGYYEMFCGLVCEKLSLEAKLNEPILANLSLMGQDGMRLEALTFGNKKYTLDCDGSTFGSGGLFGNTITSSSIHSLTTAVDALMPTRGAYMFYEGGIKYQYVSNYNSTGIGYDAATADLDGASLGCPGWTSPDNMVDWKIEFSKNQKSQYGLMASGQKYPNYQVPGQRGVSLDLKANFDSFTHYKEMLLTATEYVLYTKIRMGTSSKALLFRNGHPYTAKKKYSKAEIIAMPIHIELERRQSPNTYVEWVNW